jgi:hypothetical protein
VDLVSEFPWQSLVDREFETIDRNELAPLFDVARVRSDQLPSKTGVIPSVVFQYWNDEPDSQVSQMLEITRNHCEKNSVQWRFFSEKKAAEYLLDKLGVRYERAFWKCVHQAQRSAFFRYCFLLIEGGMWLDADQALARSPLGVMSYDRPVYFQRLKKTHRQLTNWILVSPKDDPIMGEIVETSLRNIENEAFFEARVAMGDIPLISEFWIVRRSVARAIHQYLRYGNDKFPPVKIIDETVHDHFVASSKKAIGSVLDYKKTNRAWQNLLLE